eukprot:COSAG06_NODE_48920_length_328_cov_100.956332_1_plen_40_part_10
MLLTVCSCVCSCVCVCVCRYDYDVIHDALGPLTACVEVHS